MHLMTALLQSDAFRCSRRDQEKKPKQIKSSISGAFTGFNTDRTNLPEIHLRNHL